MEQDNIEIKEEQGLDTSSMYLDEIKRLKENTVSKSDYDKLLNENRNLLKTVVEGSKVEESTDSSKPKISSLDLAKKLKSGELNNLDYVDTALKLRNQYLEETGKDLFLPNGHDYAPNNEDQTSVNDVADFLQDLVDVSDGNSEVFTREYQRRVIDSQLPKRRKY